MKIYIQAALRIILGLFMVYAAISHFTFHKLDFEAQVPNWLPFSKSFVVIASGVVELLLGLAMIFAIKNKYFVGIALATFFLLIFPGNIAQYVNHIDAFNLNSDSARLIRLFFQPILILWALWATDFWTERANRKFLPTNFYELTATDARGKQISMSEYKNKPILIVNTATKCGLAPQLNDLEALYQKYRGSGLEVLGFPSNQFAYQEPGNDEQIAEACAINYGVTFKMFAKSDVNGANANDMFKYLKNKLGGGYFGNEIKWNFTKFLVDAKGVPFKRYAPSTKISEIEKDIKSMLEYGR